jgi:hypothetical protein
MLALPDPSDQKKREIKGKRRKEKAYVSSCIGKGIPKVRERKTDFL